MTDSPEINIPGSNLATAKDEEVAGLTMSLNSRIQFLPENLHDVFPNLMAFSASYCSLTIISRENFRQLYELRELHLDFNQIEKVEMNTFEDLTKLRVITLSKTFYLFRLS